MEEKERKVLGIVSSWGHFPSFSPHENKFLRQLNSFAVHHASL